MKDHGHLIATLVAIALVLGSMILLVHQGQKLDAMASLGFGVVLGNLTGAFSPSFADRKPNVANLPNATSLNVNEAPQEPK
jgi:hypothetical protein